MTSASSSGTNPAQHPAAQAWSLLQGTDPVSVEVVKEGAPGSDVYRLRVANGSAIIAKRSSRSTVEVERLVYEQLLPRAGLRGAPYHGSVDGICGDGWLFLGEVRGDFYRPQNRAHTAAAARWLAALHRSLEVGPEIEKLPDRGPDHYLGLLTTGRESMEARLSGFPMRAESASVLAELVEHFEQLAGHWDELEAICREMPQALVHGDFVGHNIYVRASPSGPRVVPIDWEKAGWGTPAEDLSNVEIRAYWAATRDYRRDSCLEDLEALAGAGKIFRCLVFLDWLLPRLEQESLGKPLQDLVSCRSWLDNLLGSRGWLPCSRT